MTVLRNVSRTWAQAETTHCRPAAPQWILPAKCQRVACQSAPRLFRFSWAHWFIWNLLTLPLGCYSTGMWLVCCWWLINPSRSQRYFKKQDCPDTPWKCFHCFHECHTSGGSFTINKAWDVFSWGLFLFLLQGGCHSLLIVPWLVCTWSRCGHGINSSYSVCV